MGESAWRGVQSGKLLGNRPETCHGFSKVAAELFGPAFEKLATYGGWTTNCKALLPVVRE